MKIGILSHPLDYNYGCLLQAYALQRVLTSMGHDVITINRYSDPHQPYLYLLRNWLKRFLLRVIKGSRVSLQWNPAETMQIKQILSSSTQKFVDRNIRNTGVVFPKDLEKIDRQYMFDAYVVGSDQVWLPHFALNCFLDFVHRDDVKRVFYAASSGAKSFANDPIVLNKCQKLVNFFSGISVREDCLIPIVRQYLNRDAIQVLDPTLLLDADDYLDACVEKENENPVVFTYILDKSEDKTSLIDRVQKELNLPVVSGTVPKDYRRGINVNECIYPSVDHWILNLKRSRFVITDSFHGTCMSIVFRKPFVVVGNPSRGLNRFISVLKLFKLENRLISNCADFSSDFYQPLSDEIISAQLTKMREISISFLKRYL